MKEPKYSLFSPDNGSGDSADELLEQLLKTDNMTPLPADFADRIAAQAIRRYTLKQSLSEFFVYVGVILVAAFIFCTVFYFTSPEVWNRWGNVLLQRWNFLAGTAATAFFIFFTDRVLFPWLFFRPSRRGNTRRKQSSLFL